MTALLDGLPGALNGRQRSLLAVLALDANRTVSTDRLIAALWNEPYPARAITRVRTLVSELRRALPVPDLITTGQPGYRLNLGPERLDLDIFQRLVRRARQQPRPHDAIVAYDQALALFRGAPLHGASGPLFDTESTRLAELRTSAVEERTALMLAAGRYTELIPQLSALTGEHPVRERAHAQLMRALDGAGRRSEALSLYAGLRGRLVDELGVEPSEELQRLYRQLLLGGTGAVVPPSPTPGRPMPAAAEAAPAPPQPAPPQPAPPQPAPPQPAPSHLAPPQPASLPSRQLPPPPARLVGRTTELADLDTLANEGPTRLGLVVGPAGVGKTALVVHWAHRATGLFPDGQLYLNLRGFDQRDRMTAAEALPQLLRALHVPAQDVPLETSEQIALHRSVTADRRLLLVLDNVSTPEQVRDLLPAGQGCLTLVTSRDRLTGLVALDGGRRITLDVLRPADAIELMSGAGVRFASGRDGADLARLCGYLPLALRIAAARVTDQPNRSIGQHVEDLVHQGRLTGLQVAGDSRANVRGAFALTYRSLPASARAVFPLVSVVPMPAGLSPHAAAALARISTGQAEAALDALASVHLVTAPTSDGRYGCHDLLLDYAAELAAEDPAAQRLATDRLLEFYLHAIDSCASMLVGPIGRMLPRPAPSVDVPLITFADASHARAWATVEWDNLLAAVRHAATNGHDRLAWLLADALRPLMRIGGSLPEIARVGQCGLAAARRADDPLGEAAMHYLIGLQYFRSADYRACVEANEQALECYRAAGWRPGQAVALGAIGGSLVHLGQVHAGARRLTAALEIYDELDDRDATAVTLVNLAGVALERGDFIRSLRFAHLARPAIAATGNRHAEAIMLANLGLARHAQGRLTAALRSLSEALDLCRTIGARHQQASVLISLGTVHLDAGRTAESMSVLSEAEALAAEVGDDRLALYAANGLARAELHTEQVDHAIKRLEDALNCADAAGHQHGRVEALLTLSRAYLARGEVRAAHEPAVLALTTARRCGYLAAAAASRSAVAACLLALDNVEDARRYASRALRVQRRIGNRLAESRTRTLLAEIERRARYRGTAECADVETNNRER
ncbi:AfsR/SARP family transcriptional regulator [Rugosimonospora africana]|uniref:AfsR/SARP family transcriptional regulator n=1 Tax=Rugosimonospora africana TaxID=556532 RepID=UPI001945772A|nr:BTAD domain-containing putative transcriptional regulator [Rugosimonospora africana]